MKRISHLPLAALVSTFIILVGGPTSVSAAQPRTGQVKIVTKARSITLAEFKLDGVTFWDAVGRLQATGKQHDPDGIGINFLVTGTDHVKTGPKITLVLQAVTLLEATERLAEAAKVRVSAQDYAIVFDTSQEQPAHEPLETNDRPTRPSNDGSNVGSDSCPPSSP